MYPIIFSIGSFQVHTYGLLVAAGFSLGIYFACARAEKFGLSKDLAMDVGLLILLAGMAGGRILYVLLDLPYYFHHPAEIILQRGGFVFYGGVLFAAICSLIYLRRKNAIPARYADLYAPSIALGHSLGRWGCFFQGCCFGKPTHFFTGIRFPVLEKGHYLVGSPPALKHLDLGMISPSALFSLPIHPTQLYESFGEFSIFVFLLWQASKKKWDGFVFLNYIIAYSILRFIIEYFRDDDRGPMFLSLSPAQWISLFCLAGAGAFLWIKRKKYRWFNFSP